jgi:hypothetical protein
MTFKNKIYEKTLKHAFCFNSRPSLLGFSESDLKYFKNFLHIYGFSFKLYFVD